MYLKCILYGVLNVRFERDFFNRDFLRDFFGFNEQKKGFFENRNF